MPSEPHNPAPDDVEGDGGSASTSTLTELYRTLGAVQAGLQVREHEAREAMQQVTAREEELAEQRDGASPDEQARIDEELDQLSKAWVVLTHDLHEEPGGLPADSRQEGDSPGDERPGDRDDRGADGPAGP